jgi:hypothetical protein
MNEESGRYWLAKLAEDAEYVQQQVLPIAREAQRFIDAARGAQEAGRQLGAASLAAKAADAELRRTFEAVQGLGWYPSLSAIAGLGELRAAVAVGLGEFHTAVAGVAEDRGVAYDAAVVTASATLSATATITADAEVIHVSDSDQLRLHDFGQAVDEMSRQVSRQGIGGLTPAQVLLLVLIWLVVTAGLSVAEDLGPPVVSLAANNAEQLANVAIPLAAFILASRER